MGIMKERGGGGSVFLKLLQNLLQLLFSVGKISVLVDFNHVDLNG